MLKILEISSIPCIGRILGSSSKILRYAWVFLLFCGIIALSGGMVLIILKYISHPVIVNFVPEFERFSWPAITICNPTDPLMLEQDQYRQQYWRNISRESRSISEVITGMKDFYFFPKDDSENAERTVAMSTVDMHKFLADANLDNVYNIRVSGLSDDFELGGGYHFNFFPEFSKIFSHTFVQIGENVPCQTIEIFKDKNSIKENPRLIDFLITLNYKGYEIFNSSFVSRSLYMYITNEGQIPQEQEQIRLFPGTRTSISLTQNRYHYNKQKRKCRTNNFTVELYDALYQKTSLVEGGFDDCRKIVSQELIVDECKCYSPLLPIYKNKTGFPRLCFNLTIFDKNQVIFNYNCIWDVFNKHQAIFYSGDTKGPLEKCKQFKVRKCDIVTYKVHRLTDILTETRSKTHQRRKERVLKKQSFFDINQDKEDPYEYMRNNVIKLAVIRMRDSLDLYGEENEYPFEQLMSDIGGLMGLWLGMGIVEIFEILEIIYEYINAVVKRKRRRNENQTL